jgi:hypothetical protein
MLLGCLNAYIAYKKLQGANQAKNLTASDLLPASLLTRAEEYDEVKWSHPFSFQHRF